MDAATTTWLLESTAYTTTNPTHQSVPTRLVPGSVPPPSLPVLSALGVLILLLCYIGICIGRDGR
jgi:hypothetical protein